MNELEIGKLVQCVEDMKKDLQELKEEVHELKQVVNKQDILLAKGKTALYVLLAIAGTIYSAVELFIKGG